SVQCVQENVKNKMNIMAYPIVALLLVAASPSTARPQFSDSLLATEFASIGTNAVSDISSTALGGAREFSNGIVSFSTDFLNQGADFVSDTVRASSDTALDGLTATRSLYDATSGYFVDQLGRTGRLTTAALGTGADLFVAGVTAGGAFTTALAQATLDGFKIVGDEFGNFFVDTVDDTVNLASGATGIIGGTAISSVNRFTGN
ncbi:unnamed protein product, partial [Meganyctiphanes norvegica]